MTSTTVAATYPPSAEFAAHANADATLYDRATADREAFWAEQAGRLHWH
ncbi:acetyl-coenzyme A synthetase N-terminal domain-containing protein, partial [Nocardia sp. JCM 34519]